MNWTNFLLILTLLYLCYYGINLLFDLRNLRKPPKDDNAEELLFFDDDSKPQLIEAEKSPIQQLFDIPPVLMDIDYNEPITEAAASPAQDSSNPIYATGAVGMNEMLSLAKKDLIVFTGELSY